MSSSPQTTPASSPRLSKEALLRLEEYNRLESETFHTTTFASTAQMLEYLTLKLGEAISSGLFERHWAVAYMSPDMRTNRHHEEEAKTTSTGPSSFFEDPRLWHTMFPESRMRVHEPLASVDEKGGRAQVYVHFEVTGAPPGITRRNMSVVEWKLGRERWECVEQQTIRGFGEIGLPG